MIIGTDDPNQRELKILQSIRDYVQDAEADMEYAAHHDGYEEGYADGEANTWDEARNKGYDEGWEDACQYIIDKHLGYTGIVITPKDYDEYTSLLEVHADNTAFCMMMLQNWLTKIVTEMKVNKND